MEVLKKVVVWFGTMMMIILVRFAAAAAISESQSSRHRVEWSLNVNYTEWSIHQHFYVGDYLYFESNNSNYKVLEVNKTNYENCTDDEKLRKKYTEWRRLEMLKLMEARPYYFISTAKDYCIHGMKLAICVQNIPPNPQPSDPVNDDSPSRLTRWIAFFILVAMAATYICIHKLRRRR